jgi:hypothetical protein
MKLQSVGRGDKLAAGVGLHVTQDKDYRLVEVVKVVV